MAKSACGVGSVHNWAMYLSLCVQLQNFFFFKENSTNNEDTVDNFDCRPQLGVLSALTLDDALFSSSSSSSSWWSSRSSINELELSANTTITLASLLSRGSTGLLFKKCWLTLSRILHKAFRAPGSSLTMGKSANKCLTIVSSEKTTTRRRFQIMRWLWTRWWKWEPYHGL